MPTPTLFVCHGDDGGPRFHPCRRVQEALRAADIEYEKVSLVTAVRSPSCAKARVMRSARRPERRSYRHSSCPTEQSLPTRVPSSRGSTSKSDREVAEPRESAV